MAPQERDYSEIEDLVLLRSDGHPLYNLSVVIDDIEMGITHVIRGQDHLTNTHKQILLYEALGASVPQFAHLPLILAPNKGKLSKRKHGEVVSLTTYRDRGFVPAAFRNFLALLGWSPADGKEILSVEELVEKFSLEAHSSLARGLQFSGKRSAPLDRRKGALDERRIHSHHAARRVAADGEGRTARQQTLARGI